MFQAARPCLSVLTVSPRSVCPARAEEQSSWGAKVLQRVKNDTEEVWGSQEEVVGCIVLGQGFCSQEGNYTTCCLSQGFIITPGPFGLQPANKPLQLCHMERKDKVLLSMLRLNENYVLADLVPSGSVGMLAGMQHGDTGAARATLGTLGRGK